MTRDQATEMTPVPADPRGGLIDSFGRVGRDLRVSLTDHCNLRCTYCMPAEGLPWMAKPEMLSDDELLRLVAIFVGLGITKIRLTGGEPLLRAGLVGLVGRVAALTPRPMIAMTTSSSTKLNPSCPRPTWNRTAPAPT